MNPIANIVANASATEDLNVAGFECMPSPRQLKDRLPLDDTAAQTVLEARRTVCRILDREDERLFVIVGPCSIHDPKAGLEYARRLQGLAEKVHKRLYLIMRVYFEKPRTVNGWKGFINDPRMDDSFHIEEGIGRAREFLLDLARMGMPTATEALDPISPQYLGDLVAWYAIGARTSESQTHREMASALSAPVGFKNGTQGDIAVAINGIRSARTPHSFLGIDPDGTTAVVRSRGNRYGHVVLRGGQTPNYDSAQVALCEQALASAGLNANIVIDCSHANSFKKPELQPLVFHDCIHQVIEGNRSIIGLMLESNLVAGNQSIPEDLSKLVYGCSVTDACIGWAETEKTLLDAVAALNKGLPHS